MSRETEELPEVEHAIHDELLRFIASMRRPNVPSGHWWKTEYHMNGDYIWRCLICGDPAANSDMSFPRLGLAAHGAAHLAGEFRGDVWDAIRAALHVNAEFARELFREVEPW